MAQIQFRRAEAFVAGDLIIRMDIDGAKAGSLIGARPLELQLPAGTYTLQARMLGTQKGAAVVLRVGADTEALTVSVSGTRLGLIQTPMEALLGASFYMTPWAPLWLFTMKITVFAIWLSVIIRRWKQLKPHLLRLSVCKGIISESPASSRRLSSPR